MPYCQDNEEKAQRCSVKVEPRKEGRLELNGIGSRWQRAIPQLKNKAIAP